MLIDTHAHLCDPQFSVDRPAALSRARENRIGTLVEIADSPSGWDAAEKFAAEFSEKENGPKIHWTCGFHPHYASEQENFDFDIMKSRARSGPVAIGEIGLD